MAVEQMVLDEVVGGVSFETQVFRVTTSLSSRNWTAKHVLFRVR
jgi:hypothetical protein